MSDAQKDVILNIKPNKFISIPGHNICPLRFFRQGDKTQILSRNDEKEEPLSGQGDGAASASQFQVEFASRLLLSKRRNSAFSTGWHDIVISGAVREGQVQMGTRMLSPMLACCKVYISESRNRAALESIERAVKHLPEVVIVNKFEDEIYNRVGYTVVSRLQQKSCMLKAAVLSMVKAAFENINLELHSGSHPRLGVVDHVCFHPLARTNLDHVACIAKSLAVDVGSSLQVPAFLYGAAHGDGRTLDSIRRELGYFKPNSTGNLWVGGPDSDPLPLKSDAGPSNWARGRGVVVIGATQWVDNYNVPVYTQDIATVRKFARRISCRGGGLDSVQTMALVHGDGVIEVACNLLDPCKVGSDKVQAEVERLAREAGMSVGKGYFTDFSQEKIIESFLNSGTSV